MAEIIISGSEGRLEGRYHHATTPGAPVALVLHPHPVYGGTMNNKVVYRLFHAFVEQGFSVLRFNFRGVGKSQGVYSEGIGELTDAATALDWLQQQNKDSPTCWIAGFSFGAWIALQLLMRRPELEGFIAASPPANKYDFTFLAPCPASGLITMGDKDDVVTEESVSAMAAKLSHPRGKSIQYSLIHGADHYYRNHLDDLDEVLKEYIAMRLQEFSIKRQQRPDRKRRQWPKE